MPFHVFSLIKQDLFKFESLKVREEESSTGFAQLLLKSFPIQGGREGAMFSKLESFDTSSSKSGYYRMRRTPQPAYAA